MPKVSIVMPLFNKAPYVHEALRSILNQDFHDFELIIIDDKSTDNTLEIVNGFQDDRIRLFTNCRNMGQADSLNNGIERSHGEYITFAHGDDIWLGNFLSTHLSLMEKYREITICHALAHSIDDEGNISYVTGHDRKALYEIHDHDEVIQRLVKGCYIATPTVFLRNGTFPFFNNRYKFSCDWDLWLRIAAGKRKFLSINVPLIFYRYSSGNVTSLAMKNGTNIIEEYLALTEFFSNNHEYRCYRNMALGRLSMRTMRLSREVVDKETILLYHKFAIMSSLFILLNPVYYLYLFTGQICGHEGMKRLKRISKFFSRMIRRVSFKK